jgi:hypothetical protein
LKRNAYPVEVIFFHATPADETSLGEIPEIGQENLKGESLLEWLFRVKTHTTFADIKGSPIIGNNLFFTTVCKNYRHRDLHPIVIPLLFFDGELFSILALNNIGHKYLTVSKKT